MVNSLVINRILARLINGSALVSGALAINGTVFSSRRAASSKTEDIVINNLGASGDELNQIGEANVNIYVPDLEQFVSEGPNYLMPNEARTEELANTAVTLLNDVTGHMDDMGKKFTYVISILAHGMVNSEETNEHFYNIRLDYRIFENL